MSRIALISCVSKKLTHAAKAKDIYVSPLFQLCLQYAQSLRPDLIFVLSAKYGLVTLEQELEPYDDTLNTMRDEQIKSWAHAVLHQLQVFADLGRDNFIFLAGERYRRHLIPRIRHFQIPMLGLTIGKQLQYLKQSIGHEQHM